MVLIINGVDFAPFIRPHGYRCSREDRDGGNGMMMLNGEELRDRLAVKRLIDVECRALNDTEAVAALSALEPEYLSVTHTDPARGGAVTRIMTARKIPTTHLTSRTDGTEWWEGISFQLRER